jgi:hypothetical protein
MRPLETRHAEGVKRLNGEDKATRFADRSTRSDTSIELTAGVSANPL